MSKQPDGNANRGGLSPAARKWLITTAIKGIVLISVITALVVFKPWQYLPMFKNSQPTSVASQTSDQPAPVQYPTKTPNSVQPTESAARPTVSSAANNSPTTYVGDLSKISPADEIRVGFPAFGSYFNATVTYMMDDGNRPYKLVLVPFDFTGPNGETINPGSEEEQAALVACGCIDVLLNTPDILITHPELVARIVLDVDQSDGADKGVYWPVGKTKSIAGKPITRFNDISGGTIVVVKDSVSESNAYYFMRLAEIRPDQVTIIRKDTIGEATDVFINGEADVFFGWSDTHGIDNAIEAGGKVMYDSSQTHNIVDHLIFSGNAIANKRELLDKFLIDWAFGLKLIQEDPAKAYGLVADWKYPHTDQDGVTTLLDTNDWTLIYPDSALDDAKIWMEGQIAQATLEGNISILSDGHETLFLERLIDNHETWAWGGEVDVDGFDPSKYVDTSFLNNLALYAKDHPEIFPSKGEMLDPNYHPFSVAGTPRTASQLEELPTIVDFNCSKFQFKPGQTSFDLTKTDEKDQYDTLLRCVKSLVVLSKTGNVEFLLTASAAYPMDYTYARSENFANRRAQTIANVMKDAGVDEFRIVIKLIVGTHTDNAAQQENDRWIKIEIKPGRG